VYFTERNAVIFECVIAPLFLSERFTKIQFLSARQNAGYLGKIIVSTKATKGKPMKLDIDATLIAQFLEALKTPHIALMVVILGALWILKASKE